MKQNIIFLAVTATVLSLLSCSANVQPRYDSEISVVIDRTDPITVFPTAETVVSAAGLTGNNWLGCRVTITAVTDKDVNDTYVLTLPRQDRWSGNDLQRRFQIAAFRKGLEQRLSKLHAAATCPRSIIYRAIVGQCRRLMASHAKTRILAVWSNLVENSSVSFYDPPTLAALRRDPAAMENRLAEGEPLPALPGLQVWLIYQPRDYEENGTYMAIANFYRGMLSRRGAAVHVESKLQLP